MGLEEGLRKDGQVKGRGVKGVVGFRVWGVGKRLEKSSGVRLHEVGRHWVPIERDNPPSLGSCDGGSLHVR